jgi:hypothetical protein
MYKPNPRRPVFIPINKNEFYGGDFIVAKNYSAILYRSF